MINWSDIKSAVLEAAHRYSQPSNSSSLVNEAVDSGQYRDAEQATLFVFAQHFDIFDTAAKGGDPDGKVSQEDIEAVAENASGEYPPEVVEFAKYLLSSGNQGVLDRLDKGSGRGGDDNDIVWQDVANVLKHEEPPAAATAEQQAQFVDIQIQAILNAEAEGDFNVVEANQALAEVLDDASVNNAVFAAALVERLGSDGLLRVFSIARYAELAGVKSDVLDPLQKLIGTATLTSDGRAALTDFVDTVIHAENMLSSDVRAILSLVLAGSEHGQLPDEVLTKIADSGLVNVSDPINANFAASYFRALAGNPEAALEILQAHPELLYHDRLAGSDEFIASVDALLGSLSTYVANFGDFQDAVALAGILNTIGLNGAEANQDAVADAIEQVLPILVEGIASGEIDTGEIALPVTLAGDLVQRYLEIRAGDDPARSQEAVLDLLGAITSRIELTPESYGAVTGLVLGGLHKHFDRIKASDEQRNATISGLASAAANLAGGIPSGWGVALAVTFEGAAALYTGTHPPRDYEDFANQLQGSIQYGLLTDKQNQGLPDWNDTQAGTAIDWMNTMILLNGG